MRPLRLFLSAHRALAALLLLAALALRLTVPAGFMPMWDGGRLTLALCSGHAPAPREARHAAMPGMTHHAADPMPAPPGNDNPCAFADLALPLIGGADAVLLAAAILFVLALARVLLTRAPPRFATRWRPPSHAPPAFS